MDCAKCAAACVVLSFWCAGCAPQVAMTPRERGESMLTHGHHQAAAYWFDRAIREDPSDGPAYVGRARARSQSINLDEWPADRPTADLAGALADYDRAVELAPKDSQVRANRGVIHAVLGQTDAALADIDDAMRLGNDPLFHGYRGLILLRAGRDQEAQVALDRCIAEAPGAKGELRRYTSRIKSKRATAAPQAAT